jgi:hypothetical protein
MFVHKTEAKKKWWDAIRQRQTVHFLKSKDTMITHDGYDENNLEEDMENEKNLELRFDDILDISFEEKDWGSVLLIEYEEDGKNEKHQYSIAQDWVKYPAKEPTKYMKVDWEPFVQYIKDNILKIDKKLRGKIGKNICSWCRSWVSKICNTGCQRNYSKL